MASLAEYLSKIIVNTPARERPKTKSEGLRRFAKDTMEGFSPPVTLEGLRRFLSPAVGQYGVMRTGQDVATYGREDINKMAENFVERPGVNQYPRLAAAIGAGGSLMGDMLVISPRDAAGGAGVGKILSGLNKAGKALSSSHLPSMRNASEKEWVEIAEKAADALKESRKALEHGSQGHHPTMHPMVRPYNEEDFKLSSVPSEDEYVGNTGTIAQLLLAGRHLMNKKRSIA